MAGVLELERRDHADLAVQSPTIEPVDAFRGRDLEVIDVIPGLDVAGEFGLEERRATTSMMNAAYIQPAKSTAVGDIRGPQLARRGYGEAPFHHVLARIQTLAGNSGARTFGPTNPSQSCDARELLNRAASDLDELATQLSMGHPRPIAAEARRPDSTALDQRFRVA